MHIYKLNIYCIYAYLHAGYLLYLLAAGGHQARVVGAGAGPLPHPARHARLRQERPRRGVRQVGYPHIDIYIDIDIYKLSTTCRDPAVTLNNFPGGVFWFKVMMIINDDDDVMTILIGRHGGHRPAAQQTEGFMHQAGRSRAADLHRGGPGSAEKVGFVI